MTPHGDTGGNKNAAGTAMQPADNPAGAKLGETAAISLETCSSSSPPAGGAAEGWVGRLLGKYQVTGVLGRGGMGVVLRGRDPLIERDVAIKVLADHLATDAVALARFQAEAKAAGRLSHPNVASIYEIGQEGSAYFLVMEFASGGSLADRLEKHGALSVLEATSAIADACKGIAAAHAAGLIHRDVKPANFLLAADGSIKVTDFGLAKATSTASQQITQAGVVLGTPAFMSPEQCRGEPLDARSDIYSLGAAYYCLLTGRAPYEQTDSVMQMMYSHCHAEIPDPRTLDESIPAACGRIIAKAMAKNPADRYQTARELLADLEAVRATLSGQTLTALPSEKRVGESVAAAARPAAGPRAARFPAVAVGGGAALVVVLAAIVGLWRVSQRPAAEAAAAASAVPASAEPIKIGVLHSLSGTMATSEMVVVDATLFAIEEINRSGGVLGRPLKAVVADGKSDPAVFAREAERLIHEENVCTIFGCWTSASRKTVKPVVEDHDHLLVYPLQYEGLETSPNVVYLGAAPNQQILPAIEWAYNSLGKRRFFLVGSDYVFPRAANEIIKDDLVRLGAEVVGEQYVPLGSTEINPVVQAIIAARPDMILNTINGDTNIAFFHALRSAQVKAGDCPTLSFSIGEQGLRSLSTDNVAGDYLAWTYFQSVDTPENHKFVSQFQEVYPQRVITDPMETAYVGVLLWARAANDAQSLEPRKIRRAMLQQRFASPGGEVRLDSDTQHCYKTPRIGQVQADGSLKIVWQSPQPVAPDPYPSSRTAEQWQALLHDLYTAWGNRWSAP